MVGAPGTLAAWLPAAALALCLATPTSAGECPAGGGAECRADGAAAALRVNASRLWASVEAMAAIGGFKAPDGSHGVRREALTVADINARKLLDSWAAELGLKREVDGLGNTYYRRPGRRPHGGTLAFGSHLDSQPAGGRFDGTYGVLAGLELLRVLQDHGISTDLNLELVNWCNEEGSRFSPPMMGSGTVMGEIPVKAALETRARGQPGVTFGSELQRHGLSGKAPAGPLARNWVAYLEPHIEQGPMLEQKKVQVGVVLGGIGQRTFTVEVDGVAGHSGTVPHHLRRDALVCASDMVLRARDVGEAHGVLVTVGSLDVRPGSFNTIPDGVTFSVDMRSANPTDGAEAALREAFAGAAKRRGCGPPRVHRTKARPPVAFDSFLRGQLHQAAQSLGLKAPELWSGAGHDACYVQNRVPSAMIFVPCAGGISHNPAESALPEDLAAGADVLLNAVLRTMQELPGRQSAMREFYGRCTLDRRALAHRTCKDGCDVVFLGDSIMERMNGDDICRSNDPPGRRLDNQAFRATFARHGRSVILAGRSDETNHTLHLLDAALPALQHMPKAPKLYSLLIGTNNLGYGVRTVSSTLADIETIVARLRKAHPSATVLVHALLPRWDNPEFNRRNRELNRLLKDFVGAQAEKVEFLDCGEVFPELSAKQLMHDGLHPNVAGYTRWYEQCMRPVLERLVGPASASAELAA
mmetsp:Transcript_114782/g.366095  ORF Transcript_114782/g.366095 Transcript_114782/m.366095 type:complete len:699 (+) Transcript_114782:82-2178(+)